MNCALIKNNKIDNIIVVSDRSYKDFENAVVCDNLPVAIGDDFIDGKFYRDGKIIYKTDAEKYVQFLGNIITDDINSFYASKNYQIGSMLFINGKPYIVIKQVPIGKYMYINEDVVETTITDFMEEKNNE